MSRIDDWLREQRILIKDNPCISPDFCLDWPALRARPQAHIVNVSSMAGLAGLPWQTLYCTTKFAVRGFSAALRSELVGDPVANKR